MKKILFIIGSLREGSFNRKLAEEAERMLDGRATVEYLDYSDVPLMNQDFEFIKIHFRNFLSYLDY